MQPLQPEQLPPALQQKWSRLLARLQALAPLAVAFSGGVDSGLLAAAAYLAAGDGMLACTIHSPVDPPGELETARALAQQVGFRHVVLAHDDLLNPQFTANPPERCYHCKLARLERIRQEAQSWGVRSLLEGSNADDESDYRPGRRAVAELGALSPLAETGLTKAEIRTLAHALGLPVWDRPSAPCLATRFPYGTPIDRAGLERIAAAEVILQQQGYRPVRVRHYGPMARLEIAPEQIGRLVEERQAIVAALKALGYQYICIDLEGYRSGSMNEVLKS